MLDLEACKRVEWAGRDDTAEVEHDCPYCHPLLLKSDPSMTADSPSRHEECKSAFPPEHPPVSEVSPLRSGTPGLRPDSIPIRSHVGSSSEAQAHPAPLVGRCDRSSC